jgi:uncharacterized membrane protein
MNHPTPRDDAPIAAARNLEGARQLLTEAVTINRPAADLFAFWRDPANLAAIMENVTAIEPFDAGRSRWHVKAPGDRTVSWISEITHEEPGKALTWQSAEGSDVTHSGRITFSDAGPRGTVVRATIAWEPPGGALGTLLAKLFQREPRIQTRRDLRRFKQAMEAGEIATGARNARERDKREEQ